VTPNLPVDKMLALRHGVTGRIWFHGACWLWTSIRQLQKVWDEAKEVELVQGNLRDHKIVTIHLKEA